MTNRIFQRLLLGVVITVGVLSIVATSPPPSAYHFQDVSIEPAWRCPGADVEISWVLSQPAPVKVSVGGVEQVVTSDSGTTLPAELLDRGAPVSTVTLQIDSEDADTPDTYEITTLAKKRIVEDLAFHDSNMTFRLDQTGAWDDRVRIVGIKVEQVRKLACNGGAGSPPVWQVRPPSGKPFILRAHQKFSARLKTPLAPGGNWRLIPQGRNCRLPKSGLEPYLTVRFTAVCVGADSAS